METQKQPELVSEAAKIQQVLTWMLEGNSEHLIREAIEGTWPGERAEPLMLKTIAAMSDSAEKTRRTITDWSVEALRFLYQKQVEIGEFTGALRTVGELRKLAENKGAGKPAKETVTPDTFPRVLNVDARKRELAERIARLG